LLAAKSLKPLRIRDTQGSLPIHRAASIGSTTLVNIYMFPDPSQKAASPINASDRFGMTALHHACAEGHIEVAVLLVQLGAETDRRDKEGQTPLDLAPDDKIKERLRKAIQEVQ
jgi:26S proteasome non-ATPase regulatory subunit 10